MSEVAVLFIVLGSIFFSALLPLFILGMIYKNGMNVTRETYWVTDGGILQMIDEQPDKLLSAAQLSILGDMTKSQARARLTKLLLFGLLKKYTAVITPYYGHKYPLARNPVYLEIESEMTFDDLMTILRDNDYRITLSDVVFTTNLSVEVARKELKRFKREKIIQSVRDSRGKSYYILGPDYRDDVMSDQRRNTEDDISSPGTDLELLDLDVIEYAMKHKGKVSSADLVKWKGIEDAEASDLLEQLREKRFFEVIINDAGNREYQLK